MDKIIDTEPYVYLLSSNIKNKIFTIIKTKYLNDLINKLLNEKLITHDDVKLIKTDLNTYLNDE